MAEVTKLLSDAAIPPPSPDAALITREAYARSTRAAQADLLRRGHAAREAKEAKQAEAAARKARVQARLASAQAGRSEARAAAERRLHAGGMEFLIQGHLAGLQPDFQAAHLRRLPHEHLRKMAGRREAGLQSLAVLQGWDEQFRRLYLPSGDGGHV